MEMTPDKIDAYKKCFGTISGRIVIEDLEERFATSFPCYDEDSKKDGLSKVADSIHRDGNIEVIKHIQGVCAIQITHTQKGEVIHEL